MGFTTEALNQPPFFFHTRTCIKSTCPNSKCLIHWMSTSSLAQLAMAASVGVIDLTGAESEGLNDRQPNASAEHALVDLTREGNAGFRDHMQAVVDLLHSEQQHRSLSMDENPRSSNPILSTQPTHDLSTNKQTSDLHDIAYISSEDDIIPQPSSRSSCKRLELKRFPFLDSPSEIRNCVYKALLTTPNAPIELPKLKSVKDRVRMTKCRNTKKARKRALHKTIFLEILVTCRQVHDEATGIMYGCNVFKYRSNHSEGPRAALLPTRHLQLLKHIKIAVISANPHGDQETWVADLIKCFVKDEIHLDTFEMSWFGWRRYVLEWDRPVCQALLSLKVKKQMVLYLTGAARMKRVTKTELERRIKTQTVAIHRPCDTETGQVLDDHDDILLDEDI